MSEKSQQGELIADKIWNARNLVVERIYTGPVRKAAQETGLNTVLRRAEASILGTLSPGDAPNVEIRADDTTCEFFAESILEYGLFQRYPETEDMPVLDDIVRRVRPDDVFWDVGANVGIYSCLASKRIETGSVIAIEPHPENFQRIRTNLKLNDTDGFVRRCALGAGNDETTFYLSTADVPGSYGSLVDEYGGDTAITVEILKGDSLIEDAGLPAPTVMKVDVEGAELNVLKGLANTLDRDECRVVYCNVCSVQHRETSDEDIYRELESHGYEVEHLWDWPDGKGHYVRAEK